MDIPVTLLVLLALPFVVGGVVLAVSAARRRKAGDPGSGSEPEHRGQADTAAVQDTEAAPPAGRKVEAGRARRAASSKPAADDLTP
jgi:hypothetical protein